MMGRGDSKERTVSINDTVYTVEELETSRRTLWQDLVDDGLCPEFCTLVNNCLATANRVLEGTMDKDWVLKTLHTLLISYWTILGNKKLGGDGNDEIRKALEEAANRTVVRMPDTYLLRDMPVPNDNRTVYLLW